jgi:dTMP kinase
MKTLNKGILIAVEGIDGSGKSTLALNLYQALRTEYSSVTLTKEPGDSQLGLTLRSLLQEKPVPVCPKAEYLLFAADRAQHMHEVVAPALSKKSIVISDRMADSSVVYQGYGRGLDIDMIARINTWAMDGITPDLVLYVSIPLSIALERITLRKKPLSSFEQEQTQFTQKLLIGFEEIFKKKTNVINLDGTLAPQALMQTAKAALENWIDQHRQQA